MVEPRQFASRGGLKLQAALDAFDLSAAGCVCADFGCNVGGFTDCLLQAGASKVYTIDTGYGELAWTLRNDPRVVVMERTNALHLEPPEPVDLVVADMAWTPQSRILPAAMAWLKPGGRLVSLLKPIFELAKLDPRRPGGKRKSLDDAQAFSIAQNVLRRLVEDGYGIRAAMVSPIRGKGGNHEFLLLAGA